MLSTSSRPQIKFERKVQDDKSQPVKVEKNFQEIDNIVLVPSKSNLCPDMPSFVSCHLGIPLQRCKDITSFNGIELKNKKKKKEIAFFFHERQNCVMNYGS